jgi:hypothetical protein
MNAQQGTVRSLDMAGAFYTKVGTIVHEVMQQCLCQSGKFLADYHCYECGTTHKQCYKFECCDFPTQYRELKIDYGGITGHIDAVYKDDKGRMWILDFKTTSISAAPKKKKDPGVTYVQQIETYAVLFELQYGIKIEGIMDAFILRDNPRKDPAVYSRVLTDEARTTIRKRLRRYAKMHQAALDAATLKEAYALMEFPRCTNEYCKACKKTPEGLKSMIRAAYKMGKDSGNVPIRAMAERHLSRRSK